MDDIREMEDGPAVAATSRMVKTKKPHLCVGQHIIPKGSQARCEHAVVDGHWYSNYICEDCLKHWDL